MHILILKHTTTSSMLKKNNQSLNQLISPNIKISLVIRRKIRIQTKHHKVHELNHPNRVVLAKVMTKHLKVHELNHPNRVVLIRIVTLPSQIKIRRKHKHLKMKQTPQILRMTLL